MKLKIRTVNTKKDLKKFIKSQWNFYRNDPNFVPPLIADRLKTLDTNRNPFFKHSEIAFFLAENSSGEVIGRIAAIKNDNHNKTHNDKVGFWGFFECINDQQVANELFLVAEQWLASKGLDTMRGPINLSQNDTLGLLIEGFDGPPVVLMTYNPKYYIDLIQNAGFAKAKDLFAYLLVRDDFMTDKLKRLQSVIRERNKVTIRNVEFRKKDQYKKDVATLKTIYNGAWEPNWGFVKMTDEEFDFLAADLKQIAEPDFTFIAESNGKPAGFVLALPDINVCLRYNKSGRLLTGIWHLLTKKKKINLVRIIILGVLPEFQKTGIDSVLYYELGVRCLKHNIEYGEASWILEDNIMMNRALQTTVKGNLYRKYRIYERPIK